MEHAAPEEPVDQLLRYASRTQLRRYQGEGLIPRPTQRGLGRGLGTEVLYPPGTTQQLHALRAHLKKRSFAVARWCLWWDGYAVSEVRVRELMTEALRQWAATFEEWSDLDADMFARGLHMSHVHTEARSKLLEFVVPALPIIRALCDPHVWSEALENASVDELGAARDELRAMLMLPHNLLEAVDSLLGRGPVYDLFETLIQRIEHFPLTSQIHAFLLWLSLRRFERAQHGYRAMLSVFGSTEAQ